MIKKPTKLIIKLDIEKQLSPNKCFGILLPNGNHLIIQPNFIHEFKYGWSGARKKYDYWLIKTHFYIFPKDMKRIVKEIKKNYGIDIEWK